ncbi:MAG: hypothetical protein LKG81_04355 [Acetobacter peroxydans]|nr:hypothetical protein [Acetobacter peroxydans]
MHICRRLFVVPLANDMHGKSTIIRILVSQAIRRKIERHRKGARKMITPWSQEIDAYVFGRSYQEVEKGKYKSILKALNGNDPDWKKRELIVMPSHVGSSDISDIQDMIDAAHSAGFDTVAVPIVYYDEDTDNREDLAPALALNWDVRWTISNPCHENPEAQLLAFGNDLWSWISRALVQ